VGLVRYDIKVPTSWLGRGLGGWYAIMAKGPGGLVREVAKGE